jgi:hypothetical protein
MGDSLLPSCTPTEHPIHFSSGSLGWETPFPYSHGASYSLLKWECSSLWLVFAPHCQISVIQTQLAPASLSGTIVSVGLVVCGMISSPRIQNFLTVSALWKDPSTYDPVSVRIMRSGVVTSWISCCVWPTTPFFRIIEMHDKNHWLRTNFMYPPIPPSIGS